MKSLLVKLLVVTGVMLGITESAHAGWYDWRGFYHPTCHRVWIQTGPFYGEGFFRVVCN